MHVSHTNNTSVFVCVYIYIYIYIKFTITNSATLLSSIEWVKRKKSYKEIMIVVIDKLDLHNGLWSL